MSKLFVVVVVFVIVVVVVVVIFPTPVQQYIGLP